MARYEDLEGKVALITGGSGDIGQAAIAELTRQGCRVYFTYNSSKEQAQSIISALAQEGREAVAEQCNIQDKQQVRSLVESIVEAEGRIDILVNNAGIYKDNLFATMNDDEFEDVIQTNLFGTFYCTKAAVDNMYRNRSGVVINISSIAGVTNSFGQANYSSAKGAVIAFGRTIAAELAPKNIRVNTINVISFLASEDSSYIVGQTIVADGGLIMR